MSTQPGRCLAMWSGPRNLSTAMMRSWGSRSDTVVVDEPLYAHYLHATGIDHPMAAEIIATGNTDWRDVIEQLAQPPTSGLFYQKHITTHWMPWFPTDWLRGMHHVFLIRDPLRVVASYSARRDGTTAEDLGYEQQFRLFEIIRELQGESPPVIDSARFLLDPELQLRTLCASLSLPFELSMLSWPAGGRETDGVWEAHWYDSVKRSTGFAAAPVNDADDDARELKTALSESHQALADQCKPYYEALLRFAL